jgi:hypothetical protein
MFSTFLFLSFSKKIPVQVEYGGEVLTVLINEAVNAKINSLGRYIAVFHLFQTINVKQWYIVIYIWSKDKFWIHVVQKSSCAVPGCQKNRSEAEFS